MNENNDKKVVVEGTFDCFHDGHKHLLQKANSLGSVKIALTTDKMAQRIKGREVDSYTLRKENLCNFLVNPEIEAIEDPVSFLLYEQFDYMIVSPKTKFRAEKINISRKINNEKEIKIVEVNTLLAEDGEPISSARIREGEIDVAGKLIINKK